MEPENNSLALHAEMQAAQFLNEKTWGLMEKVADVFIKSGALPAGIKNVPQAMMIMQAGVEAGLRPIEAFQSFYFVNGKLSMYGEAVIAQVRKAGHKIVWGECNDQTATVTITRCDTEETMTGTFTMAQATLYGLTKNPIYKTSPANMLKFKAFHSIAKFIAPDAIRNMEMGEIMQTEYGFSEDSQRYEEGAPPANLDAFRRTIGPRTRQRRGMKDNTPPINAIEITSSGPVETKEEDLIPEEKIAPVETVAKEPEEAPAPEPVKPIEPEVVPPAPTYREQNIPTAEQAEEYDKLLCSVEPARAKKIEEWILKISKKSFHEMTPSAAQTYLNAIKNKLAEAPAS